MTDRDREARRLDDEARRARQEAERLRREARAEAERIKAEARRLREEARRERLAARGRPAGPSSADWAAAQPGDDAEQARVTRLLPPLDGIAAVEIDNTAGTLAVRPCEPGEEPAVIAAARKNPPEIEIERAGDALRIHIRVPRGWLFIRRQAGNALVRLPALQLRSLRLANGYGEVEAAGLGATSIRINTGAGSITALQLRGDLEVSAGAGKISVLAHQGTVAAHSGSGDIMVDLATLEPGTYRVDVGLGRAMVRVPPGAPVEVRASSGLGKASVDVPSTPGAPALIRVNSGLGEVAVRPRDAEPAPATPPAARGSRGPGPARAADLRREAEELRVLQLLEQGRITTQEAADLIAAIRGAPRPGVEEP